MTVDERRKYLRRMRRRYGKASRKEEKQLLDEMEVVTGQHRKSLLRSYLKNGVESGSTQMRRLSQWTLPTSNGEF